MNQLPQFLYLTTIGWKTGKQHRIEIWFVEHNNDRYVLHGKGMAIIMAGGSDVATFTGEAVGRLGSSENISWRGSIFYSTSSNGKLSFLNNMVGVFESEIDAEGNFSDKTWEWK